MDKVVEATDYDSATHDASSGTFNTAPHTPNTATLPDDVAATMEYKTSVRQLLDVQIYPIFKGDIIKKLFNCGAYVKLCVAYLHVLSQLRGCPRYTGDIITLCTCLQLIPIDNNRMLGADKFMVDFRGIYFNANKALYINFHNHASIFVRQC